MKVSNVRTWHHGLMARWWAEFNRGGRDVDQFLALLRNVDSPILDAGCGTGRLLLPLRQAGHDVDGIDAAPDMLAWCRRALDDAGLDGNLYPQPMHQLDLPRVYGAIVVCGAFGLGGTRDDDLEGLRRLRAHLMPGGRLIMDHHLPNVEQRRAWANWIEAPLLPADWPGPGDRRRAADGSELELRMRMTAFDPLDQTMTLEMRAAQIVDGVQAAMETASIDINLYFKPEIELMLRVAGFDDVRVTGGLEDRPAAPWQDARIVFHARA
jgi:SAM-dependent methyltransferase